MLRLQNAAEEAMANNDPNGAALFSGRAALMAAQLAARQGDALEKALLVGREELFRAQERMYRALALFNLAGGKPPASAGVCGMLEQSAALSEAAAGKLRAQQPAEGLASEMRTRFQQVESLSVDLVKNSRAIGYDVQCH